MQADPDSIRVAVKVCVGVRVCVHACVLVSYNAWSGGGAAAADGSQDDG